jgi:heme-degrading monooxygenase HmoA
MYDQLGGNLLAQGGLMIGVLTHHWPRADRVEAARNLLDANGLAQSKAPGFVSRQTLHSTGDPTKITTLVVWTSNDTYDQWRASPERAGAMKGAEELWSRAPESERFHVACPRPGVSGGGSARAGVGAPRSNRAGGPAPRVPSRRSGGPLTTAARLT